MLSTKSSLSFFMVFSTNWNSFKQKAALSTIFISLLLSYFLQISISLLRFHSTIACRSARSCFTENFTVCPVILTYFTVNGSLLSAFRTLANSSVCVWYPYNHVSRFYCLLRYPIFLSSSILSFQDCTSASLTCISIYATGKPSLEFFDSTTG